MALPFSCFLTKKIEKYPGKKSGTYYVPTIFLLFNIKIDKNLKTKSETYYVPTIFLRFHKKNQKVPNYDADLWTYSLRTIGYDKV